MAIRRRRLLAAGALLAAPSTVRAQDRNGVALVIGNSRCGWEAPLPNVKRDAPDFARVFQSLGLKTELLQDASHGQMLAAVERFKAAAAGAGLAAFYFAGHGAAWGNETYLASIDTDLANPESVKSLLSVANVGTAMKGAANRLLVFDNCRNNPSDGWRQRSTLAQARMDDARHVTATLGDSNTLAVFSTAPGRVALDGPPGGNSPFAASLLRLLQTAAVDLQALPAGLRRDLLISTQGRQVLWDQNNYTRPFVLNGPAKPVVTIAAPAVDPSRIVELTNAYAFARDKRLTLPAGLVACRPPAGSPHAEKVGAFQFTSKVGVGTSGGTTIASNLLIVLAINGDDTAEAILSSPYSDFATNTSGTRWRFVTARLSAKRLDVTTITDEGISRFDWRDNDTGSLHQQAAQGAGYNGMKTNYSSSFARLD